MTNPRDASTSDPVISLRNVSMSYGSRRVLDGIDLDVYRGEILVLLGGSGSGKSRSRSSYTIGDRSIQSS